MEKYNSTKGKDRTKVFINAQKMGDDMVVLIYNKNAHLGAMALGEYDPKSNRTSVSIITRLGHKDDTIAQKAAYQISKATHRPACVIAGIHLENITESEIKETLENADGLVKEFISN
jgi:hypothetical protein